VPRAYNKPKFGPCAPVAAALLTDWGLYSLLAQGRISPRRASALAHISSLLVRTLPAIDNDPYPHAGKPGFSPTGDPVSQNEIDATDDTTQSEDTTKSQKPN
jgi:hypothetical protein